MDSEIKKTFWNQLGAAIDQLENAILACPDNLWFDRTKQSEYWYVAFHTLFWLDYYFTESFEDYTPPPPFTLDELDPAGIIPEKPFSKDELLTYLEHGRKKSKKRIETMTDEQAQQQYKIGPVELGFLELILYTTRHLQHHAAQLNLILRQNIDSAPRWVFRAKE